MKLMSERKAFWKEYGKCVEQYNMGLSQGAPKMGGVLLASLSTIPKSGLTNRTHSGIILVAFRNSLLYLVFSAVHDMHYHALKVVAV